MTINNKTIYTIGHSNHQLKTFITLLKKHNITAVADVRSLPFSKHNPQFNSNVLEASLKQNGIAYVFLGRELGARPNNSCCYDKGLVNFRKLLESLIFKQGIKRLFKKMEQYNIALLCTEKEPLDCHRAIFVCYYLRNIGLVIKHILYDGAIEDHNDTEQRLLKLVNLQPTLFNLTMTEAELIEEAYNIRAKEIAYNKKTMEEKK